MRRDGVRWGTSVEEALDYGEHEKQRIHSFTHTLPPVTYKSPCQRNDPFVFLKKPGENVQSMTYLLRMFAIVGAEFLK